MLVGIFGGPIMNVKIPKQPLDQSVVSIDRENL